MRHRESGSKFLRVLLVVIASTLTRTRPARGQDEMPNGAGGDVIVLKDGRELRGRVVQQGREYVVVLLPEGEVSIAWGEIARVVVAPRAEPATPPTLGAPGAPLGFATSAASPEAERVRKGWLADGGGIFSYEVRANGMGLWGPGQDYEEGQLCTGASTSDSRRSTRLLTFWGAGGGAGGRIAYMLMQPPGTSGTWWALRAGAGADLGILYYQANVPTANPITIGPGATCTTYAYDPNKLSATVVNVPFEAGAHVGIGGPSADKLWAGVVLGAHYAPAFSYTTVSGNGVSSSSSAFSAGGFELTIDYASFSATMERYAPPAHARVAAFVLPPMKQDDPWIVTGSFGAVWY